MPESPSPSPVSSVDRPSPPVPGRGRRIGEIGLQRLRESWVLKACAISAFMGWGGLIALTIAGKLTFGQAAMVAVMSLASWFFLFWWLPVIANTIESLGADSRRRAIGVLLESIAIGCVVLVHALMAVIVVYAARSSPS